MFLYSLFLVFLSFNYSASLSLSFFHLTLLFSLSLLKHSPENTVIDIKICNIDTPQQDI